MSRCESAPQPNRSPSIIAPSQTPAMVLVTFLPSTTARASAPGRASGVFTRPTWASRKRNIAAWSVKSSVAAWLRIIISSPSTAATGADATVQPMCCSSARWKVRCRNSGP